MPNQLLHISERREKGLRVSFATCYAFSSFESHHKLLRAIFRVTGSADSAFYRCGNWGTHESSPCAWSQATSVNDGCQPQVWRQGSGPPELHHLGSTQAGENKLGTKMEMIERKYARVDAKINYKTFTFKMRSWNSSQKSVGWPGVAEQALEQETTYMKGISEQGLLGALESPTLFLGVGGRYLLGHQTYPFSNTWIKSCAQTQVLFSTLTCTCTSVWILETWASRHSWGGTPVFSLALASASVSCCFFSTWGDEQRNRHSNTTQYLPRGFFLKWEQKASRHTICYKRSLSIPLTVNQINISSKNKSWPKRFSHFNRAIINFFQVTEA